VQFAGMLFNGGTDERSPHSSRIKQGIKQGDYGKDGYRCIGPQYREASVPSRKEKENERHCVWEAFLRAAVGLKLLECLAYAEKSRDRNS
jgi:hypothetical protein